MMLRTDLVLQLQSPTLLTRRTGKVEGEFALSRRSIRGSAIGDVDFGGSRQLIRRQGDVDGVGVPAIQHDRTDLISQEQAGCLWTGQRRFPKGYERLERRIIMSRQSHQNVVGDTTQPLMLRGELADFRVRRRRSGILARNIPKYERD